MKWRCQTSTNSTRARSSNRKNACRDPASRASSRWRPTRPPSPLTSPSMPPLTNTWHTTSTAIRWDRSAPCWGWRPSTLTPTRKTATRLRSSRWRGARWLKTMTRRYLIAPTDVATYRADMLCMSIAIIVYFLISSTDFTTYRTTHVARCLGKRHRDILERAQAHYIIVDNKSLTRDFSHYPSWWKSCI